MTDQTVQAERIVTLEQTVVALKFLLEEREKLHAEFRLRTDLRLEVLLKQSSEWAGVRKTLWVVGVVVTAVGGVLGWVIHGGMLSWTKN